MSSTKPTEVHAPVHSKMENIPISSIAPSETNPRKKFNEAALAELAESVRTKGVLQPVLVRPYPWRWGVHVGQIHHKGEFQVVELKGKGPSLVRRYSGPVFADEKAAEKEAELRQGKLPKFELVAGERRLRASKIAGLSSIPAVVSELDDTAALEVQIVENLQRADLEPLEEAEGYQVLIAKHGYSVDHLAETLKKSRSYVYAMLKLCGLPKAAQEALETGLIPKSTAELIARLPNDKLREKFAAEVLKPDWDKSLMSLRRAKEIQERSYMVELKGSPFPQQDRDLLPEAGACGDCPKLSGNNRDLFPDGRADMCTDPQCYGQKKSAHFRRLKERAEQAGLEVLDAKTSNKLFSNYTDSLQGGDYLDLAEVCHRDKAKKPRLYKQLLEGSDLKPVIAFDRKGKERKLVPRPAAEKFLKEKHKIDLGHAALGSQSSQSRYAAEDKKRREVAAIRALARNKIAAAVGAYKWKADLKTLRLLIPSLLNAESWHCEGFVPASLPKGVQSAGVRGAQVLNWMHAQVAGAKAEAEIVAMGFGVVAFACLESWASGYEHDKGQRAFVEKLLGMVGLKLEAVVNEARLELAGAGPSKAKKKPAAKGKVKK
jgi:ParB/RepB/Spo0J family partition protein